MSKVLRVFALGGNEISPSGLTDENGNPKIPDLKDQWNRAKMTCDLLASIISSEPENSYVFAHGNGPQVGNILLRSEYSIDHLHPLTLDVCGADSQGGIGYMLALLTNNAFRLNGLRKNAIQITTQVEVDENDPAFLDPTKYIGPAMTREDAFKRRDENGYLIKMYKKNDKGEEVWRRVVPSPMPKDVVEIDAIETCLEKGLVPIAVGGGGVPVVRLSDKKAISNFNIEYDLNSNSLPLYKGIEGVIDKDLASALLGNTLLERAEKRGEKMSGELFIFTDIDGAKINYQQPDEKHLDKLTVEEAQKLIDDGFFPAGSMGPKMQAAINFVRNGGDRSYITRVDLYDETLKGNAGTLIVK